MLFVNKQSTNLAKQNQLLFLFNRLNIIIEYSINQSTAVDRKIDKSKCDKQDNVSM